MPGSINSISTPSHTDSYWNMILNLDSNAFSSNALWSVHATGYQGANTVQMWLDVLGGGYPANVLDFPGCSPDDFHYGGGVFMFVVTSDVITPGQVLSLIHI